MGTGRSPVPPASPPSPTPHPPAGLQQWIGVEGSHPCLFLLSLRVLCIRSSCSKISDARFFDSIRYWFFTDTDTLCGIYFCHDKLQHVMYWYHWIDTRVSIGTSIPQHGYIDTPISTRVLFQSLWMILAMFTFFWMQSKVQWRWPDLTSVLTAGLIYTQGGAVLVWTDEVFKEP